MARTELTVQTAVRTGLNPTMTAATADGHAFDNSTGKVMLYVKNGSGVDTTVTIDIPVTVDGQAVTDKAVVVTAGEERLIGPFIKAIYNQASTTPAVAQAVLINASPTASVTYAAIKVNQ